MITRISFSIRIQLIIFIIGLILRLFFVSQFAVPPVNDLLWNDAVGWNLAQGNGFTASQSEPRVPGVFRTPAYPAFLAVIYSLFGHSHNSVYVAQAFVDAASALLIGHIALLYWNPVTAVVTASLYALYPYSAMFCGFLHQDILLVFCTLLTLLLMTKAIRKPQSMWLWFWTGTALGITTLVKPNLVLIGAVPLVSIWIYFTDRRLLRSALFASALLLCILPWVIRNYVVFGSFPPLAVGTTGTGLHHLVVEVKGGEEAYRDMGSGPPRTTLDGTFSDGQRLIEQEKKKTMEALAFLKDYWPQYLWMVTKHVPRVWITKNARWHSELVAVLGQALSWLVLCFGLAGMFLARHNWWKLLPLYLVILVITFMHSLFTPDARYTLPARPIMLCFIAVVLVSIVDRFTTQEDRKGFRPSHSAAYKA